MRFTNEAVYCVYIDPKKLIEKSMGVLQDKWLAVTKYVHDQHPLPVDFNMLPERIRNEWIRWYGQVTVFGFNSGSYHINLIKQ